MLDITIRDRLCFYCGRPAAVTWPSGRLTCSHEICKSLAWSRETTHPHFSARRVRVDEGLQWAVRRAERTIRRAEELDREFDERWLRRHAA